MENVFRLSALPSNAPALAYWLLAVLRGESGINVISIRRLRARPATVAFEPSGLEAPIPVA